MRIPILALLLSSIAMPAAAAPSDGNQPWGNQEARQERGDRSDDLQKPRGGGHRAERSLGQPNGVFEPRRVDQGQGSDRPAAVERMRERHGNDGDSGGKQIIEPARRRDAGSSVRDWRMRDRGRDSSDSVRNVRMRDRGGDSTDSVRNWRGPGSIRADSPVLHSDRGIEERRRGGPKLITAPGADRPSSPVARAFSGRVNDRVVTQHWRDDWRRDHRYDWRDWRRRHHSVFRIGYYYDPFGYNYRRFNIGYSIWPAYWGSNYWLRDPFFYRLPYVSGPYRWVRYWDDALLVNTRTGQVVDVIYDFFW